MIRELRVGEQLRNAEIGARLGLSASRVGSLVKQFDIPRLIGPRKNPHSALELDPQGGVDSRVTGEVSPQES